MLYGGRLFEGVWGMYPGPPPPPPHARRTGVVGGGVGVGDVEKKKNREVVGVCY